MVSSVRGTSRSDWAIDCAHGLFFSSVGYFGWISSPWQIPENISILLCWEAMGAYTLLPMATVMRCEEPSTGLEDTSLSLKFCISHNQIPLLPDKLEVSLWLFKQRECMVCWPASSWKTFALWRTWLHIANSHVACRTLSCPERYHWTLWPWSVQGLEDAKSERVTW